MKRKVLSLVLALVMCLGLAAPAVAAASEAVFFNGAENVQVFQKAFDADSDEANIIKRSVVHADTGCNDNCTVGSAFVVYNFDTDIVFYMVPVFNGQDCIGTVHMGQDLNVGAVWTSDTTLYDRVFDLPDGNYILYVVGGALYAESSERTVLLEDMGLSMPSNDIYFAIPYEEKVETFLSKSEDTCTLSSICALQDQVYDVLSSTTQPFVDVPEYEIETCNITNFVLQGDGPLCWAACIATIVNYKYGWPLSAVDVANRSGNNEEASLLETKNVLNSYGFNYKIWDKLSWANVKNSIKYRNPFIIGLVRKGAGGVDIAHMVTAYGYMCAYGDPEELSQERYIQFWNPSRGEKISFEYYQSKVLAGGYMWEWKESIAP